MLSKLCGRNALLGVLGIVAILGAGAGDAVAQSNTQWDSLYDRIIRLEHRLRSLEAGGVQSPQAIAPADPADSASQSLRIDRIESDLRTLLGQVQELAFQVQQLTSRLDKYSEDTEYRIQQLEAANRDRGFNTTTPDNKRTAANNYQLPDYGDLSALEQYPQESNTQADTELPPGTRQLGTIPQRILDPGVTVAPDATVTAPDTTTLSAVPDEVTSQPLADPTNDPDGLYKTSYQHLLQRRFGAAETGFSKFLREHKKHKLAGNAQYWLGESYYARGQYKQAAQAFLEGYRDHSKSTKAPHSMLKLGMSLNNLGQKKHACATFAQLRTRFPKADADIKKLAARESKRAGCGA